MSTANQPQVTFWGTRGSIPTPGRTTEKFGGNTPCVSVMYKDTLVIIDAGSGIRNCGLELLSEAAAKGQKQLSLHLLLSHTHWDHIQGLPFFGPAYIKGNKLVIYGSPNKEGFLESILSDQMDTQYFPVEMSTFASDLSIEEMPEDAPLQLGDLSIEWQEQIYHPGGSVRFKISAGGKKIIYASDVELDIMFNSNEKTEETEKHAKEYLEFIDGADLLIADGQYSEEEYKTKAHWGHTSVPVLLEVAYRAGVGHLAFFHHDPLHTDKFLNDLWSQYSTKYHTADPPMHIFWAREGLTMPIG